MNCENGEWMWVYMVPLQKKNMTFQDGTFDVVWGGGGGHPTPFPTSKETVDNIKEHQRTSRMTSYQCPQTTTIGTTRDITRIPPDTTLIPKTQWYQDTIRPKFLAGYHPDTKTFWYQGRIFERIPSGYHTDTISKKNKFHTKLVWRFGEILSCLGVFQYSCFPGGCPLENKVLTSSFGV